MLFSKNPVILIEINIIRDFMWWQKIFPVQISHQVQLVMRICLVESARPLLFQWIPMEAVQAELHVCILDCGIDSGSEQALREAQLYANVKGKTSDDSLFKVTFVFYRYCCVILSEVWMCKTKNTLLVETFGPKMSAKPYTHTYTAVCFSQHTYVNMQYAHI